MPDDDPVASAEDESRRPLTERQRHFIRVYAENMGSPFIPQLVELVYQTRDEGESDESIERRLEGLTEIFE